MARLNYPNRPDVTARLASTPDGQSMALDAYSAARIHDGTLTVELSEGNAALILTWGTEPTPHWSALPTVTGTSGSPVILPEAIIQRANRLMSAEGVSIQRDWRTKTHVLRAANRRVLPLLDHRTVTAGLAADGWRAIAGADISSLTLPLPAPSAPTAAPSVPAPAIVADPAPSLPEAVAALPDAASAAMPVQGIPAAYAGKMVLHRDVHKVWDAARAVTRAGTPMVVAMVGPSGAGKTHAVHALAAAEGLDVVKFDASGVVEPGDWFGTVVLDGNGTRFVPSDLLLAVTLPGPRVLLIDEVNRANLRALNAMLPLLDGSGTVTIPQSGKRERVNLQVQVVVTANIGSAFLGTEPLDEAIRTRNGAWIEIDHLSEADEADLLMDRVPGLERYDADNLARLGAAIRDAAQNGQHPPVSTRQLLSAARMIGVGGLAPRLAVDSAILNGYLTEGGASSERARVKPHVVGIQWVQPSGNPGDVFTGMPGDPCATCGHTAAQHGIGTSVETSCEVVGCLMKCQSFSPLTTAAGTVPA